MFLTFAFFGFLFFHFAKNMLTVRPDGWYVGQVNLYGDLVFHLGFINKFLESGQVFAQNPVYPTDKPNYPIFADFVTSQVAKITGVDFALFITTFAMGILVIYVARLYIRIFIKNETICFFESYIREKKLKKKGYIYDIAPTIMNFLNVNSVYDGVGLL